MAMCDTVQISAVIKYFGKWLVKVLDGSFQAEVGFRSQTAIDELLKDIIIINNNNNVYVPRLFALLYAWYYYCVLQRIAWYTVLRYIPQEPRPCLGQSQPS